VPLTLFALPFWCPSGIASLERTLSFAPAFVSLLAPAGFLTGLWISEPSMRLVSTIKPGPCLVLGHQRRVAGVLAASVALVTSSVPSALIRRQDRAACYLLSRSLACCLVSPRARSNHTAPRLLQLHSKSRMC